MSYYDIPESERARRGLDYDLCACLEYNPQSFSVTDIDKVLAVWEGQNDGDDWRWVLRLTDGRFVFLQGGCDYTGWDCVSSATSEFAASADAAVSPADGSEVYSSLIKQLQAGKDQTWREGKDKEFGL